MENYPKPATERAPEDEHVENPMVGRHEEDVAGVNAPESAPIPEAPAGVSEYGMATGVDEKLEGQANAWLEGKGEETEEKKMPTAPSVESEAPLGDQAGATGEATTA